MKKRPLNRAFRNSSGVFREMEYARVYLSGDLSKRTKSLETEMFIASMIFQVEPDGVDRMRRQLDEIPQLSLHGPNNDNVIVAVAETEDEQGLHQLSEWIIARYTAIRKIYPTFFEFGKRRVLYVPDKRN